MRNSGLILLPALAVSFLAACLSQNQASMRRAAVQDQKGAPGMARVSSSGDSFWMDRFEVSEIRRGDFFAARNHAPRTHVTASEAEEICAKQSKRLCKKQEWINACLGIHRLRYSYANTYKSGVCNAAGQEPSMTGWLDECKSDGELHDLVGNVMEWVSDSEEGFAAMGGSYLSGEKADCFSAHYMITQTKSEQIGFRCCL